MTLMTPPTDRTAYIRPILRDYATSTRPIGLSLTEIGDITQRYADRVLEEVRQHVQQQFIDMLDALYDNYDPTEHNEGYFVKDGIGVAIRALVVGKKAV